ncbi:E2-like conjugating enzyme atg10 [Ancistrocladus abbreviatus]
MLNHPSSSEISSWDGTISSSEFESASRAFAEKWNMIDHGLLTWSWVSWGKPRFTFSHEVDGYLSMEKVCLNRSDKIDDNKLGDARREEPNVSEWEDCTESATLVHEYGPEVHYYDYHIVYSSSYRVPVMYFRGYSSDGQPLLMDDIEKDLPANSAEVLLESKWTFITEQEHPYLNRPWYVLHPCGTNEFMRLLFQSDASSPEDRATAERYLISWISVVGQVVGLKVPLKMAVSSP